MKMIALILAVALSLTGLIGCGMRREEPKPSSTVNPSVIPSMTPDDGNVEDNGSEDGVLNTDKPESSAEPTSSVTPPPEDEQLPEGEHTQPPVNSTIPDSSPDNPEVTENVG